MLRITQQMHAEKAKQYYSAADYYTEGQEINGQWGGKTAAMLGLEGQVDKARFDLLCENRDPRTGERLTVRTKGMRSVGYDFTFSVPKSVSLLFGLTHDKEILNAFQKAVDETMLDVEADFKTRVRKNGADTDRVTGNAVWASFYHFTSRPVENVPDPQLHAHCFVFNTTWDKTENRFKAGQFRDLKRDAPYWQAAMRNRLANHLQDLGFVIEQKKDDFQIAGISPKILDRYSRRTALIEKMAAEKGITDPDKKAELGAKTRENKNDQLTWPELQKDWWSRLYSEEASAVRAAWRHRKPWTPPGKEKEAVDYALYHLFERNSVVPERTILTEALKFGLGKVELGSLTKNLTRRKLVTHTEQGRRLVTLPEVVNEEKAIAKFARQGRGKHAALVGFNCPLTRDWLDAEQQRAVRHLWESPDRVMVLRGAAGTGKTTLLQEAVEGIEEEGHRVTVLAPSAQASRGVLREGGFKNADTVARFLQDEAMQAEAKNGVILIDEASLLGTRTLARVFDLAEKMNSRLILVGDDKQHRSVERGAAFRLLQEHAGVPVIEITDIRRQQGQYREAVKALSDGRVLEGFDELNRLGWVKALPREEREERLASDYVKAVSGKNAESALVVSPTHAEGERITSAIRERMRDKKRLEEQRLFPVWQASNLTEAERGNAANVRVGDMLQFHQHVSGHKRGSRFIAEEGATLPLDHPERFQHYRPSVLQVAVGDRLRVTANGKTKDGKHRLDNGSLFTVQGFTKSGDIVVDRSWVVSKDFGHITHGYVVTSHASQGKTVDRVLIAQSSQSFPASSREQFYVSASRAKKSVMVYTDDKEALRDAIQRSDPHPLAIDLVKEKRRQFTERLKKHMATIRRALTMERPSERKSAWAPERKSRTYER